jgi:hypothetical protein
VNVLQPFADFDKNRLDRSIDLSLSLSVSFFDEMKRLDATEGASICRVMECMQVRHSPSTNQITAGSVHTIIRDRRMKSNARPKGPDQQCITELTVE